MAKKERALMSGFMDDFNSDKEVEKKKDTKVKDNKADAGRVGERGKGSDWRRRERPIQKTVHFDEATHRKINLLKEIMKKPAEDVIYDIISEWLGEHFEEKKKEYLMKLG